MKSKVPTGQSQSAQALGHKLLTSWPFYPMGVNLRVNPVELTASELRLLTYFMHQLGRIILQSELTERLYIDPHTEPTE